MDDQNLRDAAARHLIAADSDWAPVIAAIGPCRIPVAFERSPYEALVRAVAYQQLNGRAAEKILERFIACFPDHAFPPADAVLASDVERLRGCGFSGSKVASIRGIAEAALNGIIPTRAEAEKLGDEELIQRLVSLRGIGRWTVEMLLIFTLGRPDILPVDDFGVREGWRAVKSLPEAPRPKLLAEIGRGWSPYRSCAAWYLWRAADLAGRSRVSKMVGGETAEAPGEESGREAAEAPLRRSRRVARPKAPPVRS